MEPACGFVGATLLVGSRVSDPQGLFGIGRVIRAVPEGHEVSWLTLSGVEMTEVLPGSPSPLPEAIVADVRDDVGEFWRVDVTASVLGLDRDHLLGLRDGALDREGRGVLQQILMSSGYGLGGSARVTPHVCAYFGVDALAAIGEGDLAQARTMHASAPGARTGLGTGQGWHQCIDGFGRDGPTQEEALHPEVT